MDPQGFRLIDDGPRLCFGSSFFCCSTIEEIKRHNVPFENCLAGWHMFCVILAPISSGTLPGCWSRHVYCHLFTSNVEKLVNSHLYRMAHVHVAIQFSPLAASSPLYVSRHDAVGGGCALSKTHQVYTTSRSVYMLRTRQLGAG